MKCRIAVLAVLAAALTSEVCAQSPAEGILNSAYWKHRVSLYRVLPNPEGEICFLGDSITDQCEWIELTGIAHATNRGIIGDTAWGIMTRLDEVTEGAPAKVFLMIGTNDLATGETPARVAAKIGEIIDTIKHDSPGTTIYLQSVFPVVDSMRERYKNANIDPLNGLLVGLAAEKGVAWVDVHAVLSDGDGQLKRELTEDGLHLNGTGYYLWYSVIRGYLQ